MLKKHKRREVVRVYMHRDGALDIISATCPGDPDGSRLLRLVAEEMLQIVGRPESDAEFHAPNRDMKGVH